jgi:hypothetical protein
VDRFICRICNCKNNIGIAQKLTRLEVARTGDKLIRGIAQTKSTKKERQSKSGCLVFCSTIFNISYLLVDKWLSKERVLKRAVF